MQKRKIRNRLIIIGILLFLIGLLILSFFILYKNFNIKKEQKLIKEYINVSSQEKSNLEVLEYVTSNEEPSNNIEKYEMILEIPKINLKKGLYSIDSKYNNVNYNIEIIKESNMPNISNGNLILAGHNGNSTVSYFDNLNTLSKDDNVFIFYKGIKYIYKITNNYEIKKDGTYKVLRNNDKTTITLISCKKNTTDKQIVYIGEQINQIAY
jgi:LPXTG-site transpeptidase (sortase) family protein